MWTSRAPASRSSRTIRAEVVPRTMESVDQDHTFARHRLADGVELDLYFVLPDGLARVDEGAANVFVLDEAHAVGDAAAAGIAQGGVQAAVGHAHHHIRVHRVFFCQERPGPEPGGVDGTAVDDGVRPGEIDILKDGSGSDGPCSSDPRWSRSPGGKRPESPPGAHPG